MSNREIVQLLVELTVKEIRLYLTAEGIQYLDEMDLDEEKMIQIMQTA